MVTSENIPSLTIASYAFGRAKVKLIIKQHLFALVNSMGVGTTAETIDGICDDIMTGYGDLKITEIMLAFKMIREGKFRMGRNGEENRGQFYGNLSSGVICDCLHQYRFEYRNNVIEQHEQELQKQKRAEEQSKTATYDQYRMTIIESILKYRFNSAKMGFQFNFFKGFLNKKDMEELKKYIEEQQRLLATLEPMQEQINLLVRIKNGVLYCDKISKDPNVDKLEVEQWFGKVIDLAHEYDDWYVSNGKAEK